MTALPLPPPAPPGLDLAADLHVSTTLSYGRMTAAAAVARAAATGLGALGIADHVGPDPAWLDRYLRTVRAVAGVAPLRVHCGLEIGLTDPAGGTDLPPGAYPRLSQVDYAVLVPAAPGLLAQASTRPGAERVVEDVLLAALRAAAGLPVPVVLAGLFAVLPRLGLAEADLPDAAVRELGWAAARAGLAVAVSERWQTPSPRVARLLRGQGVVLVAGSAARTAAAVGRWAHVRDVAAALPATPEPHPTGTRSRSRRPAESPSPPHGHFLRSDQ